MLKNSKISPYRTKKILQHFVDDVTASDAAKQLKTNRKTIDRFYSIFRGIITNSFKHKIEFAELTCDNCFGYIRTDCKNSVLYKVHKIKKEFIFDKINKVPKCKKILESNVELNYFLMYHYNRIDKFQGFTEKSRDYQIKESCIRYYKSKDELYKYLLKSLKTY